jgi:glutamine amidotransferase
MQWNQLTLQHAGDPMFAGLGEHPWVYFVHSLHGVPADPAVVAATCEYGGVVNAAFRRATCSPPSSTRRSRASRLALLRNFVRARIRGVPA